MTMSKFKDRTLKGIWIPADIWFDQRLDLIDKILLAVIHHLDNRDSCYASNKYFSRFLGVSIPTVSRSISKLKKESLIRLQSFDGRKRVLKSNLKIKSCQADQDDKAAASG